MKVILHVTLLFAMTVILLSTKFVEGTNISVDCRKGETISAAVAKLAAHPLGPHKITVTGACNENVSISSLDNLTLQASPAGASINDVSGGTLDTVAVGDAQRFSMNGFTINGSVDCFDNSVCRTQGNTIQNSQTGTGLRFSRSHGDSIQDVVQNNNGNGFQIVNDSRVVLADDVVQNNAGNGVTLADGGFVIFQNISATNTIANNGNHGVLARDNGTVRLFTANITGNGNNGIALLEHAVLRIDFAAPLLNNITNNGNSGVHVGDQSFAFFPGDGSIVVTGNLSGTDVFCSGQFPATRGALTNLGGGTTNCVEPAPLSPRNQDSATPARREPGQ